jgi:signal transduction histidine kinase
MTTYAASLLSKPYLRSPDVIDTRLVFRVYAWLAIPLGLSAILWPMGFDFDYSHGINLNVSNTPPDLLRAKALVALRVTAVHLAAGAMVAAGICASALAKNLNPDESRRGLRRFAVAHLVFGHVFFTAWLVGLQAVLPRWICASPLIVGAVLAFVAFTAPTSRIGRLLTSGRSAGAAAPSTASLRSQYEEQIRLAARQEERARLARDLHDAVKQQLFVIQTSAATAEARFNTDSAGAKVAVDQVRVAAREAAVEMQALIEQLQAAPMENVGLIEALRQQCEAPPKRRLAARRATDALSRSSRGVVEHRSPCSCPEGRRDLGNGCGSTAIVDSRRRCRIRPQCH